MIPKKGRDNTTCRGLFNQPRLMLGNAATGLFNLGLRRSGTRDFHRELLRELAGAEDLDLRVLVIGEAGLRQRLDRDLRTRTAVATAYGSSTFGLGGYSGDGGREYPLAVRQSRSDGYGGASGRLRTPVCACDPCATAGPSVPCRTSCPCPNTPLATAFGGSPFGLG